MTEVFGIYQNYLIPWIWILTVAQVANKLPAFMKFKVLLPSSQDPATDPCPVPDESCQHPTILLLEGSSFIISCLLCRRLPSMSLLSHLCYTSSSSYLSWFGQPNTIWWRVKLVKFINVHFIFSWVFCSHTPAVFVRAWISFQAQLLSLRNL
jgi:hypothetical protein